MKSFFEIGEVVVFHNPGNVNHGKEVTILSELRKIKGRDSYTNKLITVEVHQIQVSDDWEHGPYHNDKQSSNLRPQSLRRKYEPQEVVSWDECAWQPMELKKK